VLVGAWSFSAVPSLKIGSFREDSQKLTLVNLHARVLSSARASAVSFQISAPLRLYVD
jgi:hypothetical protein